MYNEARSLYVSLFVHSPFNFKRSNATNVAGLCLSKSCGEHTRDCIGLICEHLRHRMNKNAPFLRSGMALSGVLVLGKEDCW